jgi:hypothetical protein
MHIAHVGPGAGTEVIEVFGKLTTRPKMTRNASSGRYIHVSWKPSAHAARHSTIVHRSNVAQLKRQLSADGATRVRVVRTGQRPDTHFTRNGGPPGHMHRITWKYWTGQAGSTQIPENMLKELVHRLRRSGATDIRVSGNFGESLMEGAYRLNRGRAKSRKRVKSKSSNCRRSAPAKYRRKGATRASDYAYPACFMYPIRFHGKGGKVKVPTTKKHIRTAAARFGKWKGRYPKTTRSQIGRRIEAAKRQYGIGQR